MSDGPRGTWHQAFGWRGNYRAFHAGLTVFAREGYHTRPADPHRNAHPFLARLSLPVPEFQQAAMRAVLFDLAQAQDPVVTFPLLALAFRTPVRRILWPDEPGRALVLAGRSELGIRSVARLTMSLYGDFSPAEPITPYRRWVAREAGDAMLVFDAETFAAGAKQDSYREGWSLRHVAGKFPAQMVLLTGTLPRRDIVGPSLLVEVPHQTAEQAERWDEACRQRELLPHALAGFIDWILANPDSRERFADIFTRAQEVRRQAARQLPDWFSLSDTGDTQERLFALTEAWLMLLAYAEYVHAADAAQCEAFVAHWTSVVMPRLASSRIAGIEDLQVEERFLDDLARGLRDGTMRLAPRKLGQPNVPIDAVEAAKVIGYWKWVRLRDVAGTRVGHGRMGVWLDAGSADEENGSQRWRRIMTTLQDKLYAKGATRTITDPQSFQQRKVVQLNADGAERVLRLLVHKVPLPTRKPVSMTWS